MKSHINGHTKNLINKEFCKIEFCRCPVPLTNPGLTELNVMLVSENIFLYLKYQSLYNIFEVITFIERSHVFCKQN